VDGSIALNSQCGQAVNSGIRSHIEDDLGSFCRGLPTSEDIFFQEICTEKIELPLQHFAEVTWHLKSAVLQVRHTMRALVTDGCSPEQIDSSQLPAANRKAPRVPDQETFES